MPPARPAAIRSPTHRLRWATLLVASLLLHALALAWIDGRLVFPSGAKREPPTVEVALLPPPPSPAATPETKPKPVRKPPAQPPRVHHPPVPPAVAVAPDPGTSASVTESDVTPAKAMDDTPALAEVMPEMDYGAAPPHLLWQAVDLPPSAELHYNVYAFKDTQHWYGNGVFRWESRDSGYRLVGEASATLLFFKITVLNFSSEGVINEYGLAPLLYTEKPWRKPAAETRFDHAQQVIHFSGGSASHPYLGGEQDRASVLWQLAGIGRAAPDRFQPGTELDVVVAGTRDAKAWRIRILGQEEIDTDLGKLQTWHLARVRPEGSGEQRIDVWLAPSRDWYPVKVRQTDADGDYLDLSLAALKPLDAGKPNRMENE